MIVPLYYLFVSDLSCTHVHAPPHIYPRTSITYPPTHVQESRLIEGVAFKKTFSYAGFEMQRKKFTGPKIALLNVELELKAEKENAELRIENVEVLKSIHVHLVPRSKLYTILITDKTLTRYKNFEAIVRCRV